ncbi:tetraprenyl-beta-curcumene synthase family protein [Clostridiaceae bacterium 35-E11]
MYYPFIPKSIKQSTIIYQFVKNVFPQVKKELSYWQDYAHDIPDPILSQQALASIQKKSFHAQGGSIYSLYYHKIQPECIKFIVALQTISDYLDNLCDRVGVEDEKAFLQLHLAITDALHPSNDFADYYQYYPHKEDGQYLYTLVSTCKGYIRTLSSFHLVQKEIFSLGKLYGEMQSLKHITLSKRETAMHTWAKQHLYQYHNLSTWEFAAAAGSTLGIFLLCTIAHRKDLTKKEVQKLTTAYFPWICGLHILLDYFIDEQEDLHTGDLNFVSYYANHEEKEKRLMWFLEQSINQAISLDNKLFHITIIEGLLAMYLSDPKTALGSEKKIRQQILKKSSYTTNTLYLICRLLRQKSIIH